MMSTANKRKKSGGSAREASCGTATPHSLARGLHMQMEATLLRTKLLTAASTIETTAGHTISHIQLERYLEENLFLWLRHS